MSLIRPIVPTTKNESEEKPPEPSGLSPVNQASSYPFIHPSTTQPAPLKATAAMRINRKLDAILNRLCQSAYKFLFNFKEFSESEQAQE